MPGGQLAHLTKFQDAHDAAGNTGWRLTDSTQFDTGIAFGNLVVCFPVLRDLIGAGGNAALASVAQRGVLLNGTIISNVKRPGHAGGNTGRRSAMVAGLSKVVFPCIGILAGLKISDMTKQHSNRKAVYVLTGGLTGLAADAIGLIVIKSHGFLLSLVLIKNTTWF